MNDDPQQDGQGSNGSPQGEPGAGASPGKKGRPRRTGWRRFLPTWRMTLGGILVILLVVVGGFIAGYLLVGIPPANQAAKAQSNVFLFSDGTQLARDGEVNRENVKLSQVPKSVQHAVLAAEDRNFYNESAVNPIAMVRAAWNTVIGRGKQSGSTITQQYVKNYYLGQEQTITRKAKEFFIAIKLDREVSKDEILEGYLNTSYYGRNAYGIQAAAQAYYNKDVEDLNAAQGAYLATLLNAPSQYDIVVHPENRQRAEARWNYVMDGMVKKGWLSGSKRAATKFDPPGEAKTPSGLSGRRGYFVNAIKDYLRNNDILDEDDLKGGGYRITTTIDKKKQLALEKAVDDQVMKQLDKKNRDADKNVRAGGASIDPATGKVVAMYGGIDYAKQFVNGATRADYQVGSTFKPFVFASAVANHATTQDGRTITPQTVYDGTNKRMTISDGQPTGFAPANEDDRSYGQITVSEATDKSVNAVYAQMGIDVGPDKVRETAVDLGIPRKTPGLTESQGAISLGTATPSVLEMTGAYATIANHGKRVPYTFLAKITKNGETVSLPDRPEQTAMPREAADTTTSILRSVVESPGGTGAAAQAAGRPAAGKTGTAEEDKAAWFAGYTPDLATVIAVLGQDPKTAAQEPLYGAGGLARINGGGWPAQIWADYTAAALDGKPVKDFDLELESGAGDTQPPASATPTAPGGDTGAPSAPSQTTPPGTPPTATTPPTTVEPPEPTFPSEPPPTTAPTEDFPTVEPGDGGPGGGPGGAPETPPGRQ
ncbi:penicillin-binding protein [Streptomyces sp. Ru73]|uniref:transglycosylase domain-containing protein n=1 Tax=Streptomyces sp. Ru73 TaxID=2080748 RepID=UPI000CDD0154|nr:transglycosylase domain-containing protein [Streptomyces sp. Ru73]POX40770.1 penicillin-binding protein [Streptomyces sp. Ru73]